MNAFKKLQLCLLILCSQFSITLHAHPTNAPVETYFFPRQGKKITKSLETLFNNTENQLLMAMYWITDEKLVDPLISLKKNNCDVQIVFDESSPNSQELIDQFIENGICPLVKPEAQRGIMHNKFLVFDEKKVWTGSANFTKAALDPNAETKNKENITILHSQEIAKEFSTEFSGLKNELLAHYVDMIANKDQQDLPAWLYKICTTHFHHYPQSMQILHEYFEDSSSNKKNRLNDFFPEIKLPGINLADIGQPPTVYETLDQQKPTPRQKRFLKEYKLFTKNMSRLEARKVIESIEKKPKNTFKPYYKK